MCLSCEGMRRGPRHTRLACGPWRPARAKRARSCLAPEGDSIPKLSGQRTVRKDIRISWNRRRQRGRGRWNERRRNEVCRRRRRNNGNEARGRHNLNAAAVDAVKEERRARCMAGNREPGGRSDQLVPGLLLVGGEQLFDSLECL